MKNSWTLLTSTLLCSVAFLGCTPEAKEKLKEAKHETAEAAKATGAAVSEVAGEAAKAAADATKSAVDATKDAAKAAAEKAGEVKDAILDKASDAKDSLRMDTGAELAKLSESLTQLKPEQMQAVTDFQTKFSEVIAGLGASAAKVADVDSAKAAIPGLDEITTKLTDLATNFAHLPEAAKPYVAKVVESARENLKPVIDGLLKTPAVKEVIEPTLNTLLSKFDAFKAS